MPASLRYRSTWISTEAPEICNRTVTPGVCEFGNCSELPDSELGFEPARVRSFSLSSQPVNFAKGLNEDAAVVP